MINMKNPVRPYAAFIAAVSLWIPTMNAAEADPVITFKTRAYDLAGAGNKVCVKIATSKKSTYSVDSGSGTTDFETRGDATPTEIPCNVSKEGTVKIYGDASLISQIDASGCHITGIDILACRSIESISLSSNELESLELPDSKNLRKVDVSANNMTFATLPSPSPSWTEYSYRQNPITVSRAVKVGSELDLSAKVNRDGSQTKASAFVKNIKGEVSPLSADVYTYKDGTLSFKEALADSVYVEFTNTVFDKYPLQTTCFMVKSAADFGQPTKIASFTLKDSYKGSLQVYVGMEGATNKAPKTFYADFGNGRKTYQSKSSDVPSSPSIYELMLTGGADRTIDIYIPEGEVMTAFSVGSTQLQKVDVDKATEVRTLLITACSLDTISLAYNKNLRNLSLQGNNLTSLSLEGFSPYYEKRLLSSVNVSRNSLTECNLGSLPSLVSLNASRNRLAAFDFSKVAEVDYIDMSENLLDGQADISPLRNVSTVNLQGNEISSVVLTESTRLSSLNLSDNYLNLATLPLPETIKGLVYAPQKHIRLPENAPAVNLTAQNRVVDGKGTTFVWKKTDTGTTLVEGVDVSCKDGATKFLKSDLGKVYCELTNPAFEKFSGSATLRTTDVNVIAPPTNVVATFTTSDSGTFPEGKILLSTRETADVYIDWRGDGTEYIPYEASQTTEPYQIPQVYAGAEVKVYAEAASGINRILIAGIPLDKADLGLLTGLETLELDGTGLSADKITLPKANLVTLSLTGNNLSAFPYTETYPGLECLRLSGNRLTAFDGTGLGKLSVLEVSDNEIENVTIGSASLKKLDASRNQIGAIDLAPCRSSLESLDLSGNRMTFATLPVKDDYSLLTLYKYQDQAEIKAEAKDMKVDLSDQLSPDGKSTTEYLWYAGEVTFDPETGAPSGSQLVAGNSYSVENGITTFLNADHRQVMCVMTNRLFPGLYLHTGLIGLDSGSVDGVGADEADVRADIYTIGGILVRRDADVRHTLPALPAGIYVVRGKKIVVR